MNYADFVVRIERVQDGHKVWVIDSPRGQFEAVFALDVTAADFVSDLGLLDTVFGGTRALGASPSARAPEAPEALDAAKRVGSKLFEATFSGKVLSAFVSSLDAVRAEDPEPRGLRIKLQFSDPELARLPWELLRDPESGTYLSHRRDTPIVRYLLGEEPIRTRLRKPLRVLGMIAAPADLTGLDYEAERGYLEESLGNRDDVDLGWVKAGRWQDLIEALGKNGPWHVFHFIGHGGYEDGGFIALEPEQASGPHHRLGAEQLGTILANHGHVRLAVLNSCDGAKDHGATFSSTASTLVNSGIPAVVAMQQLIEDRAATQFARTFYGAVVERLPVDAAIAEARVALSGGSESLEWAKPTLYMKAPDGVLFEPDRRALGVRRKTASFAGLALIGLLGFASYRPSSANGVIEFATQELSFQVVGGSQDLLASDRLLAHRLELTGGDVRSQGWPPGQDGWAITGDGATGRFGLMIGELSDSTEVKLRSRGPEAMEVRFAGTIPTLQVLRSGGTPAKVRFGGDARLPAEVRDLQDRHELVATDSALTLILTGIDGFELRESLAARDLAFNLDANPDEVQRLRGLRAIVTLSGRNPDTVRVGDSFLFGGSSGDIKRARAADSLYFTFDGSFEALGRDDHSFIQCRLKEVFEWLPCWPS